MALRVPFGISTPGWLGIVVLLFVTGLYQISWASSRLAIQYKSCFFQPADDIPCGKHRDLGHTVIATGILIFLTTLAAGTISSGRGSPNSM